MTEDFLSDFWDEERDVSGDPLAHIVQEQLKRLGIEKAVAGLFLGLAAGNGNAERALARRLTIPDLSITLVDKRSGDNPDFEGHYISSDMFGYLEQTSEKFGIITVFGIEYLILQSENWIRLWQGLARVTSPGSIVVLFPLRDERPLPSGAPFQVRKWDNSLVIAVRTSGEGDVAVSEVTQ